MLAIQQAVHILIYAPNLHRNEARDLNQKEKTMCTRLMRMVPLAVGLSVL
jgi:hypothetical protein